MKMFYSAAIPGSDYIFFYEANRIIAVMVLNWGLDRESPFSILWM